MRNKICGVVPLLLPILVTFPRLRAGEREWRRESGIWRLLLVGPILAGCLEFVCDGAQCIPDANAAVDAGYCVPYPNLPELVCASELPRGCGTRACASWESCCYSTMSCGPGGLPAIGSPTRCDGMPRDGNGCSSNLDCLGGFCDLASDGGCWSVGVCRKDLGCGSCTGADCEVCGCNGFTLPSIQVACVSGMRVAYSGKCRADAGP